MILLSCLERASLFGVAALAVALFLQWILAARVPASWRVWLWRAALIQTALALVPLAPIALSVLPTRAPLVAPPKIIETPATETAPAMAPTMPAPDAPTMDAAPPAPAELAPPIIAPAPETSVAPVGVAPRRAFDWRGLLVAVYGLGIAVQLAFLARNAVRVRQILSACTPLDVSLIAPLAARLKLKNVPRLMRSAGGAPFLVGLWRPTIVLPATLDNAHLEAVLAHELAHHKRRDLAWNLVLWALQTLLWFHPLSWVARRFHALEIESACDALTLQWTPVTPKSYGALLIGTCNTPTSPLTAGVNDGFCALSTRLQRLNRAPHQPRPGATWLVCGVLLLSFAAVLPFELKARAQEASQKVAQPVTGSVVNPSGAALPGALISVEGLDGPGDIGPRGTVRADEKGRFEVPASLIKNSAQLFGNWNERTSLHGALVRGGDELKLVLNSNVLATIQGQTRETNTDRPVPAVQVELYRKIDGGEVRVATVQSDARGWFRFADLRPFRNYFMRFKSADHYRVGEIINVQRLSRAMTSQFGVYLEPTASQLRGRLLRPDGSPAVGYGVRVADGLGLLPGKPEVLTRSDGKFFFDRVTKGSVFLLIRKPGAKTARFIKSVKTGEPNLIAVRLSDKLRLAPDAFEGSLKRKTENSSSGLAALVGQVAPALRVRPAGDPPRLAALRGQTVLLCFKPYRELSPVVGNFAISYRARGVRVVCVQNVPIIADGITVSADGKVTYKGLYSPEKAVKEELGQIKWAKESDDLPIDVALDVPKESDPNAADYGGQSAALYRGATYVVVGQGGAILYAGDKFERALETVNSTL